jgi:Secretion system C-terminal sorting domain
MFCNAAHKFNFSLNKFNFSLMSKIYFAFAGAFAALFFSGAVFGQVPINDGCETATVLTVGATCNPLNTNALGATESLPAISCNSFTSGEANDVWFSFEAIGSITSIQVAGVGTFDPVMEGFSGACDSLTSVSCADVNFGLNSGETLSMVTTAGVTYFVRVYSYWTPVPTDFDFTICALTPTGIPANDQCDAVIPDELSVGGSLNWTGDNTGALDTEFLSPSSVWHAFTTTECTNVTVAYCGMPVPFENVRGSLFLGCPYSSFINFSSSNFNDCGDDNVSVFFDTIPPGTYYFAVVGGNNSTGPYTISVTAEACPTPPANDACTGAQLLLVNTSCTPVDGTTEAGDQSLDPVECNTFLSSSALDVWYSFVATGTDHIITATGAPNGPDLVLELFSGACDALTSIGCADENGDGEEVINQSGLTVGQTYTVRVYNFDGGVAAFNICVTGDVATGVNEVRTNGSFTVFPNPSNGDMTISSSELVGATVIEVLDMTGRLLHTENRIMVAGQAHTLQLAGRMAAGSYRVRLSNEMNTTSELVVIH